MNIVLLGPPGVGKGTQAAILRESTSLEHVASGELFRRQLAQDSELGRRVRSFLERGELVPDDVVITMVLDRLAEPDCAAGAILDGFPRTLEQGRALLARLAERGDVVDAAVALTASDEVLLKRIAGRETCSLCETTYNTFYTPSRLEGVCDLCGGELYTRSDDDPDTARHRLEVYAAQTFPLLEFFRERGLLREVDALAAVPEVAGAVREALGLPG